jgi:excisionase family DNA binding protein
MVEMFLTVEQAAERLQLHESTIRRQIKAGRLRSVKRGRVHRIPESALLEEAPKESPTRSKPNSGDVAQAEELWAQMKSGDARQHNNALRALFVAPEEVQAIVMRRSQEAASAFYATPEGQSELEDWRALDGEPFQDDAGDYYTPEEEAQFRAEREAATR